MQFTKLAFAITTSLLLSTSSAFAEGDNYTLIIKDHTFSPDTLEIPAGKKIMLEVDNQDPTPEEFESHELKREKIIRGNSKAVIAIGPLEPGEYPFFGEFNEDSAKGKIIVK